MGNSSSSSSRGHQDETVDYGSLVPQGVYTGSRDWNQAVVTQLICARRLAPFYRPLEDYDDSWDDDQILGARKELPTFDSDGNEITTRMEAPHASTKAAHNKRPNNLKEPSKPEATVYRGAVECPICFLYYPPNINHSRCCDQAICTECFVQIKRNEPTATHLVSEPAACPYCVQDNFGVVYTPPPWRSGVGSEGSLPWAEATKGSQQEAASYPTHKRRQKSFGADSPEVVTTDHIRPDWEAKLAAVRAAVARRANRRIIMRQVGDRLIPVGITSGRVHALSAEEAQADGVDNGGSRRSRRRQGGQNQNFEQFVGIGGQDLEELMLMEAMRLSMIDHEEHQRREAEKRRQEEAAAAASAQSESKSSAVAANSGSSTLEVPESNHRPSSPSPTSSSPSLETQQPDPRSAESNLLMPSSSQSRIPAQWTRAFHRPSSSTSSSRTRSSSPSLHPTVTAAITAATTASAFLGASNNGSTTNGVASSTHSTPEISINDNNSSHVSLKTGEQSTPLRPSSSPDTSHLYNQLPSSSESLVAHEPLLGSRTPPE